jgi:hypothetical protein
MSELTYTYDINRNNNDNGYGNEKTEGFGEPTDEFQEPSNYHTNKSTEKPRGRIRETEPSTDEPEQEEEPENSVLVYPKQKIKTSKKIPFSEKAISQKILNFKKIKKEKYRTRVKKEKEKHLKWKERTKNFKRQIMEFKKFQAENEQQPREATVHMMDSFGREIKH